MIRRVTRIAPWQAGKVCAVIYFVFGLVFGILFAIMSTFTEPVPGQMQLGFGLVIVIPIVYGLAGLIFVPIACWVYNLASRLVGGIEVDVLEEGG